MPYDEYGSDWDPTSSNVARSVERYGAGELGPQRGPAPWANRHDDPDLLTRILRSMFGQPKQQGITSQPLPPPEGYPENAQAPDPASPFGGQPPAAPQAKPASSISSNHAIIDRINKMMGAAEEPTPVAPSDFGMSPYGAQSPSTPMYGGDPTGQQNMGPLPARNGPVDLRNPNLDVPQMEWLQSLFGGAPARKPGVAANMSPFGTPWGVTRANGGLIPGFMRGGYPDLYGVNETGIEPMRTFDSGGQSYVDNEFSEAPGRADDVNAKLSAREYVVDAETMALLGDGNPDAGAKKMDKFREDVRKHKGKALAKGKISPDAKSAVSSYIAGNPMGDGLRRRGREKA